MSLIDKLKNALQEENHLALKSISFFNTQNMKEEQDNLVQWIELITELQPPPKDRILSALRQFRSDNKITYILQARYICHGCLLLYTPHAPCLIEDPHAFPMLLQYVDRFHTHPRLFRRCFQGLMMAYFNYEPGIPNPEAGPYHNRDIGWRNRIQLRDFLQRRRSCIHVEKFNPKWVLAILNNPDIFDTNLSQFYLDAVNKNDSAEFDKICDQLKISKTSWFSRGLLYRQLDEIAKKPDDEFKEHLHSSIRLLSQNRWSINKGLAKILNRYADSSHMELSPHLRDFSISQWKNPWLSRQAPAWKTVSTKAKNMISIWAKQHLIRQFFWLLAQGTSHDVRRAEFWAQYLGQINAFYFALGSHASNNSSRDFIEIRRAMEGYLLEFDKSGASDNNACIFMIGNYAIIEFGSNHIPAYIYDRRAQLPFDIRSGFKVSGAELRNLKAAAFVRLLRHQDSNNQNWETEFEAALKQLNITKDAKTAI